MHLVDNIIDQLKKFREQADTSLDSVIHRAIELFEEYKITNSQKPLIPDDDEKPKTPPHQS